MQQTKKDRVINILIKDFHMVEIEGRTKKYRCFKNPNVEGSSIYFVGKNGALRAGKTIKDSVSLSNLIKIK